MLDENQPDLNLAESAPMHLDSDVFDGLLDYALSADAHDVDDSIVPDDSPADAPGDEDLDSIALADDAADPLDAPLDDADVVPSALPDAHGGDDAGDDDPYAGIDDLPDDLPDDLAHSPADELDDFDAGAVDGGDGGTDPELEW